MLVVISEGKEVEGMLYFEAEKKVHAKVENTGNFDLIKVWQP